MNLDDFLKYKTNCPLCSNKLNLVFHSKKRQKIRQEYNRLLITFPMDSIKKNEKSYNIGFSFNSNDNSFFIEFYSDQGEKIEKISTSLLNKFLSFNTNLGAYKFYKVCNSCTNYHYESNYFHLNLQTLNVGDLIVNKERFCLSKSWRDGYKEFELLNDYLTNKSLLGIMSTNDKQLLKHNYEVIELSLLKFTSKNEMIERINKLLLFS